MSVSPADLTDLTKGCHALIPGVETSYGYEPSLPAGVVFSVVFFLSLGGHVFRSVQYRKTASVLLAVSALTEVLGWAARTWAAKCPYNSPAFMMQIITLVIAPVFVTAALYVMLGDLIRTRGEHFSVLKPKVYIAVFCTCDVVALVIQATGAAMTSHAFDTGKETKPGAHIIAGGVIFQLLTMLVFAALLLVFLVRSEKAGRGQSHRSRAYDEVGGLIRGGGAGAGAAAAHERAGSDAPIHLKNSSPSGRPWDSHLHDHDDHDHDRLHQDHDDELRTRVSGAVKDTWFVLAMWFSFVAVYVRSVFRAVQLMQGFRGYLATHEKFFIGLDGVIMFLAIAIFNVVNPYIL